MTKEMEKEKETEEGGGKRSTEKATMVSER